MTHTHFALAVIWRRIHDKIEFLVLDYNSVDPSTDMRSKKEIKFPGGTNGEYPHESARETMVREVFQETGLFVERAEEIWKSEVAPDHTKYGFLINIDDCRGGLRTVTLNDNGDELSPPEWRPAETLGRVLYSSHQSAYLIACRQLEVF